MRALPTSASPPIANLPEEARAIELLCLLAEGRREGLTMDGHVAGASKIRGVELIFAAAFLTLMLSSLYSPQ